MSDEPNRALRRMQDAHGRAQGQTGTFVFPHQVGHISAYIGLMRDLTKLAQLRLTEEGDRAAIRANHDIRRAELEAQLAVMESAIANDFSTFDALRRDNKDIVMRLIDLGELELAKEFNTRFLERFSRSSLDKLVELQSGRRLGLRRDD